MESPKWTIRNRDVPCSDDHCCQQMPTCGDSCRGPSVGVSSVGFLRVLRYLSFHVLLLWGDSPCRNDLLRPQMLAGVNRRHDVVKIPSPVKCVARRSSSVRVPSHVRTAYREDSIVNRLILRNGLQISRCKTTRICYVDGKYVAHN